MKSINLPRIENKTPKKSDPEISANLAKIDKLMDNPEAIMNETELEKVVAETTVVQDEKDIEDLEFSNSVSSLLVIFLLRM